MVIPYTMSRGRLELDEGHGTASGPRCIDPAAGLVRFADEGGNLPFSDFRAVAVVYSERRVRVPGPGHTTVVEPRMVHSVTLVPRRLSTGAAALLDSLESGAPPPPGFSIYGAAATVDEVSVHFCVAGARDSRSTAKAIARLAGLPMVELYGEFPVWRPRDRLDLTLREWLGSGPPPADPGPPPPGLTVSHAGDGLVVREAPASPSAVPRLFLAAGVVAAAAAVPLFFLSLPAAIALLVVAALGVFNGLGGRRSGGRALSVSRDAIRWEEDGQESTLETAALEMLRVVDSTLVVVARDDELRSGFGSPEAAAWARAAIVHHLVRPTAVPEP